MDLWVSLRVFLFQIYSTDSTLITIKTPHINIYLHTWNNYSWSGNPNSLSYGLEQPLSSDRCLQASKGRTFGMPSDFPIFLCSISILNSTHFPLFSDRDLDCSTTTISTARGSTIRCSTSLAIFIKLAHVMIMMIAVRSSNLMNVGNLMASVVITRYTEDAPTVWQSNDHINSYL